MTNETVSADTILTRYPPHAVRSILRRAGEECRQRGLYNSAKWTSELLISIPPSPTPSSSPPSSTSQYLTYPEDSVPTDISEINQDIYTFARDLFQQNEFLRCAYYLNEKCRDDGDHDATNVESGSGSGRRGWNKILFLKYYSRLLAAEKKREESTNLETGNNYNLSLILPELNSIQTEIESLYNEGQCDSFLLYLLGIVLNKKRNQEGAVKYLVESIKLNPYNWSCWTELSSCIATTGMLLEFKKQLPETFMRDFWEATTRIELYSHFDIAHELLNGLSHLFPDNTFIQDQHALGHYHDREFEAAEYFYDHVGELDPLRLDHVGEFSNVLYVTVNHQKLISLAHQWFEIEKYRPETCVAVANYYSAKGLHEKAVQYYQRALKIDRNFLSAWTLLGHELVELKNAAGAIKSYRSAVDIDPRDWRAWYGLGQGYELLKRYDLAVYYYEKSTTLRPYDGRLWTAKADCYAKMPKHYRTAIQCYKRALVSNDHNPATQCKLAAVYIKVEEPDRAAFYYRNALEFPDLNREFRVEAATYLSDFYRSRNLVQDAKNMLQVVIENSHNALQVADARALLEEMVEIQVEAALDGEDVDVELGE